MENLLIDNAYKDDVRKILRADDMFISGGDVAFAGMAIGGANVSSKAFASYIASLSHILTRIVLSERMVFVYSPGEGAEQPPTSYLLPLIERYCNTVQINQHYALVSSVVDTALAGTTDMFGDDLVKSVTASVSRYLPWAAGPGDFDSMANALLAEYGVATLLGAPYAPNPFVSQPFSLHALQGRTTAEELLRCVEDLRRETSQAINLYKGLNTYDLKLPAIFAAILRESNSPADLVRVASQMNGDAKAFREWSRALDSIESDNPDKYLGQLQSAEESLRRMGISLDAPGAERMQVSAPLGGLGIKLPAPTLRKILAFLDVDIPFLRPRSFLLNLLSMARQVKRLAPELVRVFGVKEDYARAASDQLLRLADAPEVGAVQGVAE